MPECLRIMLNLTELRSSLPEGGKLVSVLCLLCLLLFFFSLCVCSCVHSILGSTSEYRVDGKV